MSNSSDISSTRRDVRCILVPSASGGVRARLRSGFPLPEVVELALGHRWVEPQGSAQVELIISEAELLAPPFDDGSPIAFAREKPLVGRAKPGAVWLQHGTGGVLVNLDECRAEFFAPTSEWMRSNTFVRTLLPLSLGLLLLRFGLHLAHAAVVSDLCGRGWLLMGGGGVGKSTVAYALARRGWRLAAEDIVLLERVGQEVWAHAFWDELHLDKRLASTFSELRFRDDLWSHPTKGLVDVDSVLPHSRVDTVSLEHLVVLSQNGDAGEAHGRAGVIALAMTDNPLAAVLDADGYIDLWAQLLRRAHLHRMRRDDVPLLVPDEALSVEGEPKERDMEQHERDLARTMKRSRLHEVDESGNRLSRRGFVLGAGAFTSLLVTGRRASARASSWLQRRFVAREAYLSSVTANEHQLELAGGKGVFLLNDAGMLCWRMCCEGARGEDVVMALHQTYGIPLEQAEQDARSFLQSMYQAGVVVAS